ncbi:GDSL esterase/lipase At3g27950 isoform X2 [Ricinus communis]|uniref:GDSL esterase/lipase At3g27950 isoform X2 n=1 Tax=Ricinus communis TaxID=3988 RepID=UPI0007724B06|nr:GDSL esterase/lipase At3g27950 isoform X2 [Ricinus communis]|eukprot:XP_015573664.1 GDSL esterase/lipase At3g27950 isoform X2 [Ricinus communis]
MLLLRLVMGSFKLLCTYGILVLEMIAQSKVVMSGTHLQQCEFQAVYNFGDSNSDTGGISAALSEVTSPNGETFFGHPAGRFCDGRLIIDFLAERVKLPYLSPYLDSVGTDFRHGANFATGGSSIRPGGYSPFHLGIQISQFIQFKARVTALYNTRSSSEPGNTPPFKSNLPRPADFPRALYTFDIGQNDLAYGFQHTTEEQVIISIPDILSQFSQAVHRLYEEGARIFWVHNTSPIGCLPYSAIYNSKPGNRDQNGCVKSQNEVAQEFNKQLKNTVLELTSRLLHSAFTYVDVYSAKYQLISTAKSQGFLDPMKFCCGSYYGYHIDCGKKAIVNGTIYGNPCKIPSKHISWDGIHYSQAANQWVADKILNGSHSYPSFSVEEACRHFRNSSMT